MIATWRILTEEKEAAPRLHETLSKNSKDAGVDALLGSRSARAFYIDNAMIGRNSELGVDLRERDRAC